MQYQTQLLSVVLWPLLPTLILFDFNVVLKSPMPSSVLTIFCASYSIILSQITLKGSTKRSSTLVLTRMLTRINSTMDSTYMTPCTLLRMFCMLWTLIKAILVDFGLAMCMEVISMGKS